MNYRHAFHAGNFADVFKHAVLALILKRLAAKDAAFFYLDTHAGAARYDLGGDEAARGIACEFPFRMTKSSKFTQGMSLIYSA